MGICRPSLINQKHNMGWFLLDRFVDLCRSSSLHIISRLFITAVESILLYGSETWTIKKSFEKKLDGCYMRMALNVNWQDIISNSELYGDLPLVSLKVAVRRMKIAGHCVRHQEEEQQHILIRNYNYNHYM